MVCAWWQPFPSAYLRVALAEPGAGSPRVALTGRDGIYYFDRVHPGKYNLYLNVPDAWRGRVPPSDVAGFRPAFEIDVQNKPITDITPISIAEGKPGSAPFAHIGCGGMTLPPPRYAPGAPRPAARPGWIRGIDVSHWQGEIDWTAVAGKGYVFAMIKATEGQTYTDPQFNKNWEAARKARLVRGAYHTFSPNSDGEKQAQFFLARAPLEAGDLPPVLSLYQLNGRNGADVAQAMRWLSAVETATKRQPIVYVSASFEVPSQSAALTRYPLWVGQYVQADQPRLPQGWSAWTLWQFTDKAQVGGIKGDVPADYFAGTLANLQQFAGAAAPAP